MARDNALAVLAEFSVNMGFPAPLTLDENDELGFLADETLEIALAYVPAADQFAFSAHIGMYDVDHDDALEQLAMEVTRQPDDPVTKPEVLSPDFGTTLVMQLALDVQRLDARQFEAVLDGFIRQGRDLVDRLAVINADSEQTQGIATDRDDEIVFKL